MNVWIQHRASQTVLRAQRAPLDMKPESQRYWSGNAWSQDPADAQLFENTRTARQYRDAACLCEKVPGEWLPAE
jgi:hypothetical protein